MAVEGLSKEDAGRLIQKRRAEAGLTQDQLADQLGVDKSYISKLEGGVHGVRGSKYLPRLAQILKLTEEDVRSINPAAIFNLEPAPHPASAAALGYDVPDARPDIPDALQEAARLYGDNPAFSALRLPQWQELLANLPYKNGPRTAEEWLAAFVEAQGKYEPR